LEEYNRIERDGQKKATKETKITSRRGSSAAGEAKKMGISGVTRASLGRGTRKGSGLSDERRRKLCRRRRPGSIMFKAHCSGIKGISVELLQMENEGIPWSQNGGTRDV